MCMVVELYQISVRGILFWATLYIGVDLSASVAT